MLIYGVTRGAARAAPPHLSSDKLLTPNRILTGSRGLERSRDEPPGRRWRLRLDAVDGGIPRIAAFALGVGLPVGSFLQLMHKSKNKTDEKISVVLFRIVVYSKHCVRSAAVSFLNKLPRKQTNQCLFPVYGAEITTVS